MNAIRLIACTILVFFVLEISESSTPFVRKASAPVTQVQHKIRMMSAVPVSDVNELSLHPKLQAEMPLPRVLAVISVAPAKAGAVEPSTLERIAIPWSVMRFQQDRSPNEDVPLT